VSDFCDDRLRAAVKQVLSERNSLRAALAEAQANAERFRQSMYATEESSAAQYERANKAERERDEARTLLLEVASAGIEHSTRDYVVLQLPTATWDALETLAQEVKP